MNKIIKILAIICIVSCLACLVACDQVDENDPTALKPFAAPDPNNPYDTKYPPVDMYGNRDNHYSGHLKLMFTNTESLNNLFHDFVPEDFPDLDIKQISDMTAYYYGVPGYESPVSALYLLRQQALLGDAYEGPVYMELKNFNRVIEIQFNFFDYDKLAEAYELLYPRSEVRELSPYYNGVLFETPNDTKFSSQQQNIADLIDLESAWDHTIGSSSVKVGVLDTGILGTHPDLIDNLNATMGLDLDPILQNQFVDEYGHGTSVAGIIGAVGDNEIGISGVCWDVDLVSLKVARAILVDVNTYTILEDPEYLIQLLGYASEQETYIPILSFSGGWYSGDITPGQIDRLEAAIEAYPGLLICAAGQPLPNSDRTVGYDLDDTSSDIKLFPACIDLPNILVVGATNESGGLWAESNYGQTSVDIFAPGVTIYTTANSGSYTSITGTSAATPFVSGVAALLLSYKTPLSPIEIKNAIINSATPSAELTNKCVSGGILNALEAIEQIRGNYAFTNLGVTSGHRCTCRVCSRTFVEGHTWAIVLNGFKCAYCRVTTTNIELPYPGINATYKVLLQQASLTTTDTTYYYVDIDEHNSIIYYKGKYFLVAECDENGNLLYDIPDSVLAEGYVIRDNNVVLEDGVPDTEIA